MTRSPLKTDVQVRQAKYAGGKLWRWDYRYLGKQKTLSYGEYPAVGLAEAKARHQAARQLLAEGGDPGEAKQEAKQAAKLAAANSFEAVAKKWLAMRVSTWSASHEAKTGLVAAETIAIVG